MRTVDIYVLRNLVTDHVYVGSGLKGQKRWGQHRRALVKGKHINSYLQRSWNKYGAENFRFEIVEQCLEEVRQDRELYWISWFKAETRAHGYNICYPVRTLVPSERMSKIGKGTWKRSSKKDRANRLKGIEDKRYDPQRLEKVSSTLKANRSKPEFNAKMKAAQSTEEYKQKRSEVTANNWQVSEIRERRSEGIKKAFTVERKEQYAAKKREQWEDPEYQKSQSEMSKAIWTPKQKAKHSSHMTEKFQDDAYREKHKARMREWWAARKSQNQ